MLTFNVPKIRRMPLVEKIEEFVSLDGYSDRIAVDRSRHASEASGSTRP
jgi:hypothetical protein